MARKVFLSFVHEDLNFVNLFRGQAKAKNNLLEFSDHSVRVPYNSTDALYIKKQISDKIRNVSVTVCLIGKNTSSSHWVNWEIAKSVELGKGIVGVRLQSTSPYYDPKELTRRGAIIVGWNLEQIVNAIERSAHIAGY